MSNKEFKGVIKLDVRDSTPDWKPFVLKKAPDGAPNVLIVLYDDTDIANPADGVRPWNTLDADEKKLFARMAEVFAGMSEYADAQIGRVIDYLEESGSISISRNLPPQRWPSTEVKRF